MINHGCRNRLGAQTRVDPTKRNLITRPGSQNNTQHLRRPNLYSSRLHLKRQTAIIGDNETCVRDASEVGGGVTCVVVGACLESRGEVWEELGMLERY